MFHALFLILFSVSSSASVMKVGVSHLELSRNGSDPHLIFFENGRVGRVSVEDIGNLSKFSLGMKTNEVFEVSIEGDQRMEAVSLNSNYEPSVIDGMTEATRIFNSLNPNYRSRSECYNRAHVWSYETFQRWKVKSMKVFLFFTSKYIWDYNWDWWFHVSPYLMVKENNEITEKVIDYRFMDGPTAMKKWTDFFMIPNVECPTVEKYSDYENHQSESYCYLIKKSMYFWQPRDIEELELSGREKTDFIGDEVSHAYWQGF